MGCKETNGKVENVHLHLWSKMYLLKKKIDVESLYNDSLMWMTKNLSSLIKVKALQNCENKCDVSYKN